MLARSWSRRVYLTASLAALAAAAPAAPAAAQVDFKFTLSAANPKVAWDGNTAVGANVNNAAGPVCGKTPADYCDQILFEVQQPGKVAMKVTPATALTDVDIYLFRSDASGKKGRAVNQSGAVPGAVENVTGSADEPTFYLLQVAFFAVFGPSYSGETTFTPGELTDVPASAAPKSTIGRLAKSVKRRSLKGFSGTATDDGSVSKVEIAVVRQQGRKCSAMGASGSFKSSACNPTTFLAAKGTTKWSYRLKRSLPKGKYVLYSRATDNDGQVESTFGPTNRKQFTVR